MPIPDKIIEQIQERSDIVEVVSHYVPLKKSGRNYKANCPFHKEKTPSFMVSPDKQIYHCFGCGAGGNVFSFLMKYENMQFTEAVGILAKKAGVVIPAGSMASRAESSLAEHIYKINEAACQYFQSGLAANSGAMEYLASRGVGDASITKFKVGYAHESWDGLLEYFKKKGVEAALLEKAGLAISNGKGGHYDRFRNRIVFPIIDLRDNIIGFGARVLDASLPKYVNSPETVVYSKGRNLYGLNFSREHIKKAGYALVVEGYLDFMIPFQAGIQNIIATLGTALTIDHVKMVKRFANTVIMLYDPDEAGEAAALRSLDLLISEDVNVYVAELPQGFDPDGYIRKFGAEDFSKLIKASKNIFEYKLEKLKNRFDIRTTNGKTAIAAEMLPTLARIKNEISRSELIKKLAERLSVSEEALRAEFKKVRPDAAEKSERRYIQEAAQAVRHDFRSAEIIVLALLLDDASYAEKVSQELEPHDFRDSSVADLVKAILEMRKSGAKVDAARLISRLGNSPAVADMIAEAANVLDALTEREKMLSDCIMKIKKDNVSDQLKRIMDEIKLAQTKKDEAKASQLLAEYNNLLKGAKA